MAMAVQQIRPLAHWPLILGVLRRLEVATLLDRLIPPPPAHVLSAGRGVEALVLAGLDGDHALYTVGQRLAARGMRPLLQPGLTRPSLQAYRLGHMREALCAANLHTVLRAMALKALEVDAIPPPWLPQATTPMALYGAYADAPQTVGAPRPAYGPSKAGRDELNQVLLRLGVSGDGGRPLRVGGREGNHSERVETPLAIAEGLALGLEGVHGSGAESKAYRRRPLGGCLEHGMGLVTLVPRPWAVRQELTAWGQQPPALPLLGEKPGRTRAAAPRRWQGQSVIRAVEGESSDGRVAVEGRRFVVGPSRQRAHQQTQTDAAAPAKAAQAVAAHVRPVHARWFACRPAAEAAMAASEGRGPGRRGRQPRPWR